MEKKMANLGELPEWNLNDLYQGPDDPALSKAIAEASAKAEAFAKAHRGSLGAQAEAGKLLQTIGEYEDLADLLGRIGAYASLYYVGDTTDAARAKFYGDVTQKLTDISAQLIFFELELNQIDTAILEKAMGDQSLARFRPWFEDLRKEKPHQLDEKLELLFQEKSVTAWQAWNRLFDDTIAALRFDVEGESLAIEPTLNLLVDSDPAKRAKAGAALAKEFAANNRVFTLIINTLAKDKEISDRWRKYPDVAASRHLGNRVESEVVDALVASVRAAYPKLSHRYYAMKAKWLGQEKLAYWDRNAPLPAEDQAPIQWDAARDMVLSAYGEFAPEMRVIAQRFFDEKWIDAPVRPGKAPGAFAHPTVPSAHPYVLLNYQGKIRDVMTLAHELGHGVHQVLAADQGPILSNTPLTLAETASVFGEMLTFQKLLTATTEPAKRKRLLASKVEDMLNTVVRQIAFYCFERKFHEERKAGELTAQRLGEIWLEVQAESLGPAIELSEGYENFWCYIPHFIHSPFYVYAYAFGDCLVNSLYARYREAGEGFQNKYFEMLKAGGSKHHKALLAPFGLDASDPSFWNMGLSVIEGFIDEIVELEAQGV